MKPSDSKLYNKIKKRIYKKNPIHSAYRSGLLVKTYKKQYAKKYGNVNFLIREKKQGKRD